MDQVLEEGWHDRFYVADSKCNRELPRARRAYFDTLPQVRVGVGRYWVTPMYVAGEADVTDQSHAERMQRRVHQHPELVRKDSGRRSPRFSPPHSPNSRTASTLPQHSASPSGRVCGCGARVDGFLQSFCPLCGARLPEVEVLDDEVAGTIECMERMPEVNELMQALPAAKTSARSRPSQPSSQPSRGPLVKKRTRAVVQPSQARQRMLDLNPCLNDFVTWAETRPGGMPGMWRRLDADGSMTLRKVEFLKNIKECGYAGNPMELWHVLDADSTGLCTFLEFDPDSAIVLARFKRWVETKFGSAQAAFRLFDSEKNGSVSYKELVTACAKEGLPDSLRVNLRVVFRLMDDATDKASQGNITVDELAFIDAWKCPDYLWQESDPAAVEAFKDAVNHRHRENPLLAWRRALDRDSTMRVSYDEFKIACKRLAQGGVSQASPASGVTAIYCGLDKDRKGYLNLYDWDPSVNNLLARFTAWTKAEYGRPSRVARAWENSDGAGITLGKFQRQSTTLSMTVEERDVLFEGLSLESLDLNEGKKGTISQAELQFLDNWKFQEDSPDDIVLER